MLWHRYSQQPGDGSASSGDKLTTCTPDRATACGSAVSQLPPPPHVLNQTLLDLPFPMEQPWLERLDQPSRLLLHALASGSAGALAALRMLQHGRVGEGPMFSWQAFTDALCSEEPTLEGPDKILALSALPPLQHRLSRGWMLLCAGLHVQLALHAASGRDAAGRLVGSTLTLFSLWSSRPRLLLLPAVCQRNLLCVLHAAAVPHSCRNRLCRALAPQPGLEPWVRALVQLLPGAPEPPGAAEPPGRPALLTSTARHRLDRLRCEILGHAEGPWRPRWGWDLALRQDAAEPGLRGGKRKEAAEESLERELERPGKKRLREEVVFGPPLPVVQEEPAAAPADSSVPSPAGSAPQHSQQDGDMELSAWAEPTAEFQPFIQLHGPKLKRLLQMEAPPLEPPVPPELRVLLGCSPGQLEGLCSFLQLSSCPERLLVRFCSWLLALAPDLSYASAAILAEQLFLARLLALTQPPSRHLMAALASFCSKYALPFCRVLVAPILQEPTGGPEQTKLLCELVEECLEPEHVALVLSQVLEVPLSERLLPLVQAVLSRQEALPAELLEPLVLALCRQAPALAASLRYAKLLTALLTLHQSRVTAAQRGRLSVALARSGVALSRPLQALLQPAPPP